MPHSCRMFGLQYILGVT